MTALPVVIGAITLGQPMASAILLERGWKDVENRPGAIVGLQRLPAIVGLHASQKPWSPFVEPPSPRELQALTDLWPDFPGVKALPSGGLLGAIELLDGVRLEDIDPEMGRRDEPGKPGKGGELARFLFRSRWLRLDGRTQVAYRIGRRWALPELIPCSGALPLWPLRHWHRTIEVLVEGEPLPGVSS